MPVIDSPDQYYEDDLFIDLRRSFHLPLYLKCEGFNFAGSIKLKAATAMIDAALRDGIIRHDSVLIESSSGNLGVALALLAANKGLKFLCVTDARCNLSTRRLMEALGAQVHIVSTPDPETGLLGARLNFLRDRLATDDRYVWLNQYSNENNWQAHYRRTAPAIARRFPSLDVVFIGAGTCGTLMGCARWLREWHRPVHIVAVDAVGSITFGGPASRRMIPGLGAGVRPAQLDTSFVDEVVMVEEADTIRVCHRLAAEGFLLGGSSGTVVSGAAQWLANRPDADRLTTVAVSPDLGERYLDNIYQTHWVQGLYGDEVLNGVLGDVLVAEPEPA